MPRIEQRFPVILSRTLVTIDVANRSTRMSTLFGPIPDVALTPLYVKTVVQAAKSAAWRAR